MGSFLELNDTLQINSQQGFPTDVLELAKHQQKPVLLDEVNDKIFAFNGKEGIRIFHLEPVRVFLVQNIEGKWLFWGKAFIQSQAISKLLDAQGNWDSGKWVTSGTFKIIDIYEPEYQRQFTIRESPPGKSFF